MSVPWQSQVVAILAYRLALLTDPVKIIYFFKSLIIPTILLQIVWIFIYYMTPQTSSFIDYCLFFKTKTSWLICYCHTLVIIIILLKSADRLAHIGCSLSTNVILYKSCPTQIRNLVSNDARGTTVPRTIIV
jgi:hypothetical protein